MNLPSEKLIGKLDLVAYFNDAMPTGVTVSQHGRIFVNYPRWGDNVLFTVAEIRNGQAHPYPDQILNTSDQSSLADGLISVQSVVVDPADRLWILDTGSPNFQPTEYGGPKILCVDLETDKIKKFFSRRK